MNIGYDARLYGIFDRGLGRYNLSLLSNLAQLDQVNKYWLFGNTNRLNDLSPLWHKVSAPWAVYSLGEQLLLPSLLKKYPIDLMHWPHFNVPMFYSRPFVVTIHDMIMHQFPDERATTLWPALYRIKWSMYRRVFEAAIKKARAIIAVSEATKDIILDHYHWAENKITVIYEAPTIDGRQFNKQPRLLEEPYVLYVGAAYPHKNLKLLAEVFAQLRVKWGDLKLVLVGRSDFFYERLKKELAAGGLNKGVIFWGEATDDTLASLYAHTEVYITPSLAEGFNLSAIEAISFARPVVASNIPVHIEVLGGGALFAEKAQVDDYVKLTGQILDASASGLSNSNSSIKILDRYSWQMTAQQTEQVYQEALLGFKTTHTI